MHCYLSSNYNMNERDMFSCLKRGSIQYDLECLMCSIEAPYNPMGHLYLHVCSSSAPIRHRCSIKKGDLGTLLSIWNLIRRAITVFCESSFFSS